MTAAPRKRATKATTTKGNPVTDTNPPADPAPMPPEQPAVDDTNPPAGLQFGDLGHCPTPWVCFPRGLPENASHAVCIHGETHASVAE